MEGAARGVDASPASEPRAEEAPEPEPPASASSSAMFTSRRSKKLPTLRLRGMPPPDASIPRVC